MIQSASRGIDAPADIWRWNTPAAEEFELWNNRLNDAAWDFNPNNSQGLIDEEIWDAISEMQERGVEVGGLYGRWRIFAAKISEFFLPSSSWSGK